MIGSTWIILQNSCKDLDPIDKIIIFLYLTEIQCNFTITLIPENCKLFNIIYYNFYLYYNLQQSML